MLALVTDETHRNRHEKEGFQAQRRGRIEIDIRNDQDPEECDHQDREQADLPSPRHRCIKRQILN